MFQMTLQTIFHVLNLHKRWDNKQLSAHTHMCDARCETNFMIAHLAFLHQNQAIRNAIRSNLNILQSHVNIPSLGATETHSLGKPHR